MDTKRLLLVAVALVLFTAAEVEAQIAVGSILAPDGDEWRDVALYRGGGKLFVLDYTNARVLTYNASTLAPAGEISLSSYSPDRPQSLAVHEGTGTLYISISLGQATSNTRVLPVNASTLATGPTINNLGWDASLLVDESRSRLYAISVSQGVMKAIDIT